MHLFWFKQGDEDIGSFEAHWSYAGSIYRALESAGIPANQYHGGVSGNGGSVTIEAQMVREGLDQLRDVFADTPRFVSEVDLVAGRLNSTDPVTLCFM